MSQALHEMIGIKLGRASRLWRTKLDERLGPLGLTQAKWLILVHLSKAGGAMPQKDLVEGIGVEGPTMVRVLDGLERMGLIERCGQCADRRAKVVHLTGTVAQELDVIVPIAEGLRAEILAGITDADLAVFDRVISTMLRNMGVCGQGKP